jgi:hypothetical protein
MAIQKDTRRQAQFKSYQCRGEYHQDNYRVSSDGNIETHKKAEKADVY